ncbi:MAG: hypothetical protein M0T79_15380 [Actinomycetota bacterium]|nr:hypothetical protein [Actinomycetota bacterium]
MVDPTSEGRLCRGVAERVGSVYEDRRRPVEADVLGGGRVWSLLHVDLRDRAAVAEDRLVDAAASERQVRASGEVLDGDGSSHDANLNLLSTGEGWEYRVTSTQASPGGHDPGRVVNG